MLSVPRIVSRSILNLMEDKLVTEDEWKNNEFAFASI